ncbi:RNA-binding S4 domain-containing protein [Pelagicoccus sp. SDUM812003]|uniref:RNA-binding S4 domain-containing protein n=1 Tax=Pelagicoccus sp. SDUM812003 TaxID=3041267 RepID=UPI0028107E39|nr:RNA-binding S4 domain-containing protein [Pelagicoccus sp. SDUM812003]MDQ8204431.1 RNA-binding S4 domain-containing protein [Pelagicoccus sp. SDUM812003]
MSEKPISEKRSLTLRGEFVELNKLLKYENLVASGGEAKVAIKSGAVLVNGEVESRVRRKLVPGDKVSLGNTVVEVVSSQS